MKSYTLLEDSFIIRGLKKLMVLAKGSYLFHFDFAVTVSNRRSAPVKPYGFFDSMAIWLGAVLARFGNGVHGWVHGSRIARSIISSLEVSQKNSVVAALAFIMGLSLMLVLKGSWLLFIAIQALGAALLFLIPLIQRYKHTSFLYNRFTKLFKGGGLS